MSSLRFCTLTGVDESVNIKSLIRTARRYPFIEWGVLLDSRKNSQGIGRFPRMEWIENFAKETDGKHIKTSLHLCGDDARKFIDGDKKLFELAGQFSRVQLNFLASGLMATDTVDDEKFARQIHYFTHSLQLGRIVIPRYKKNVELIKAMRLDRTIDQLLDMPATKSGKTEWPNIDSVEYSGGCWGFAGSIGPDNLAEHLSTLEENANGKPFWVAIEGKLRDQYDHLNMDACVEVAQICGEHILGQILEKGAVHAKHSSFPTDVEDLSGMALDWWLGVANGFTMNIPPEGAAKATYMGRRDGRHYTYSPTSSPSDLSDCLHDFEVGCIKVGKTLSGKPWCGILPDGTQIPAKDRDTALMLAIVASSFGRKLPDNLAHCERLQECWLGRPMATKLQKELKKKKPLSPKPAWSPAP